MNTFRNGDIVGCTSNGWVSGVINVGTFAAPGHGVSHVGIISLYGAEPLVYESTTFGRPPCILQAREVRGAQAHKLDDWLKFGMDKVWHYPMRRELYEDEALRLRYILDRTLGTPYDLVGALRSGGFLSRMWHSVLHKEDLASVFCSEFVAQALVEVGVLQTANASSWNPNRLCRTLVKNGVCGRPSRIK